MRLVTQSDSMGWRTSRTTFWRIVSPAGRRLVKVVINGSVVSRPNPPRQPDWRQTEIMGRGA